MTEASRSRRQKPTAPRRPPRCDYCLVIAPDGRQTWLPALPASQLERPPAPREIRLYLTDPRSSTRAATDLGSVLDDAWHRWTADKVTFTLVSVGAALMRSDVPDRLAFLRRKSCRWQIILVTDGMDLTSTAMIDKVLRSPLDEVQIYPAGLDGGPLNSRVLHAVKDLLDLRRARGQTRPLVACRLPADSPARDQLTRWARQVSLDRLDLIPDPPADHERLWSPLHNAW